MPSAILMLTDDPPGIRMDLSWEGEHDPTSPAHQHMRLLIQRFHEIAQPVPEQEPELSPVAKARRAQILDSQGRVIDRGH